MHWADDVILYEGADTSFANVNCELGLISQLRQYAFDTSIIFTNARESPFSLAYICYLAGIPIRIGQSQEFGGGVLSHCVHPKTILS
jgi:ADP-heptose:LPS heptosyltransferase